MQQEMWFWIAATTAAFFVKGLCGFANTLVFTSILGFGVDNVNISPVELVLGYPSNVILTWRNRKQLNPKVYLPLAALVLAGCIPGALLLKNVNASRVKVVFGVVVILIGIEMLLRERSGRKTGTNEALEVASANKAGQRDKAGTATQQEMRTAGSRQLVLSRTLLIVIGILSGVLCGLFGVGALLAAYVGRVTESTDAFKANISAVFIVENTFRIILYTALGVITLASIRQAVLLLPFMLLGLYAGMKSSRILNEKVVKKLVIILLILSGVVLIVRNFA